MPKKGSKIKRKISSPGDDCVDVFVEIMLALLGTGHPASIKACANARKEKVDVLGSTAALARAIDASELVLGSRTVKSTTIFAVEDAFADCRLRLDVVVEKSPLF